MKNLLFEAIEGGMEIPKTNGVKLVYESRAINVVEEDIELPNGRKKTFIRVVHPGAVVILPLTDRGTILFLRQYRQAIKSFLYELPAGTLGAGEDPLECAKRELAEEAGVKAREWQALGVIYPAPGFCDEKQHLFLARGLVPYQLEQDDDEILEVEERSYEEIRTLILNGEITDAKSLAALCRAVVMGALSQQLLYGR